MKKILVTLAIFAIVGSTLFAQNAKVTASNEIYSETLYKEANGDDPMANYNNGLGADRKTIGKGFWGIRETAEGKVDTETWTLQARLRAWLWSLAKPSNVATSGMNSSDNATHGDNWENVFFNDKNKTNVRVNFWYRPLAGIEMGIGNDFAGYYQVPAGAMLGIDKPMGYLINVWDKGWNAYSVTIAPGATAHLPSFAPGDARIADGNDEDGARWAKDGFALNFTKVPNLLISVNIPFQGIVDEYDFAPKVNAGAHYNIGNYINIGATYHGGINPAVGHVFGLYGQFKNDVVRVPLGLTFGYIAKKERSWVDTANKARGEIDLAPDFTLRNGMQIGISLSAAMMFGNADWTEKSIGQLTPEGQARRSRSPIPIVFGAYYKWPINNSWTFDARTWLELIVAGKAKDDDGNYAVPDIKGAPGQFYIEPKIAYKVNAHNEVGAGVKLRFNFVTGDEKGKRNNYMGYAVPVFWKWTL